MKHPTLAWLISIVLTAVSLLPGLSRAATPLPVVASFSILGDLVQVVGGERVKVTTLVGPDADAHAFEPTPADARNLVKARLFVTNGLNFEPWAQKLATSAAYKGALLTASQGVQPRQRSAGNGLSHDESDPHAWQDPRNVVVYVKNIAKSLASLDPEGTDSYQNNSDTYIRQLEALDQFALAQFAHLTPHQRRVITSHDAFGYFAARYQIQFLAPQGVSPAGEASAKEVAQLIRQIQRDKIRAVFVENMRNPKLLAQMARDTGVQLGPKLYVDALSGPNEPGSSYLGLMRHNVTQLVAGMKLN
jgi:zinc/manganese transport system substrate-binding protein